MNLRSSTIRLDPGHDDEAPAPARSVSASDAHAPNGNSTSQVVTVNELADEFRVDKKTIYALIRRGEIPGVRRLGRAVRIHRDAALQWLASGAGQRAL